MRELYRVEFYPAIHLSEPFVQDLKKLEDAVLAMDIIADYTLFLHAKELMPDHSNAGQILKRVNGEWETYID